MTKTYSRNTLRYQHLAILIISMIAFLPFAGTASAHTNEKAGTGVQVNIGGNGGVLVRGAKVTGVSSTTINANTSLGASVLHWVVQTDNETEFVNHGDTNSGLGSIAVGDTISFRGMLDQTLSGLTVEAGIVKNWSHAVDAQTKRTMNGVITAINASLDSFTVSKNDVTTNVQTSSSTVFTKDGASAAFADLVLNAKVKVLGLFNASTSVFTANSVAIDTDSDGDHKKSGFRGWFRGHTWLTLW